MDYTSLLSAFGGGGGGYQASSTSGGPFNPAFGNVAIGRGANAFGDAGGSASAGGSTILYVVIGAVALVAALLIFRR